MDRGAEFNQERTMQGEACLKIEERDGEGSIREM